MLMGLNLKDEETVALVTEVAKRLGTSKTAAVRDLAREKIAELDAQQEGEAERRRRELWEFMETKIWPKVKQGPPITKEEIERITGMDDMEREWS
jgi:hypothetical protein